MHEFKFVVMGSTGVGKSAITIRFVQGRFVEQYDPTIEDCYSKKIEHNGQQYSIEILDTAGIEMFAAMRELYMKNGQGFILVYSITSEISFEELIKLHDKVLQVKNTTDVPIILVGNKSDLDETDRVIPTQRGRSVARSWGCPFLETSAKLNQNIDNIFTELINEANKFSQMGGSRQKTSTETDRREAPKRRSTKCPKCNML